MKIELSIEQISAFRELLKKVDSGEAFYDEHIRPQVGSELGNPTMYVYYDRRKVDDSFEFCAFLSKKYDLGNVISTGSCDAEVDYHVYELDAHKKVDLFGIMNEPCVHHIDCWHK